MGCPSAAELDGLFDAADPARAARLLAHVRECARCTEALSARDAREPSTSMPPLSPRRKRPRPALIFIAAVGLALIGLSRAIGRRHFTNGVAPLTSR